MVSSPSRTVGWTALLILLVASQAHATPFTEDPVTPLGDTAPLDRNHPARQHEVTSKTVLAVIPPADNAASQDLQRLEHFFQQPMEINIDTLTQQYPKHSLKIPWISKSYPAEIDGINHRWTTNAVENYAQAYGLDLTEFKDKISVISGVNSLRDRPECTRGGYCPWSVYGSNCGVRENATRGYCTSEWEDMGHAWAAAAIAEPEPKCDVVKNGVTFSASDIKALLVQLYNDANVPVVFLGGRDTGGKVGYDDQGRYIDAKMRDINPGLFHIAVVNSVGRFNKALMFDGDPQSSVFTEVIFGYSAVISEQEKTSRAAELHFGKSEYSYNPRAASVVTVTLTVDLARQIGRGVDFSRIIKRDYDYLLELDDSQNIIGGEWLKESKKSHPDFAWILADKPEAGAASPTGIKYDDVLELLDASVKCPQSTRTPSPSPTSSPTPTLTPTPTPTPTPMASPVSGAPCGNQNDGVKSCVSGEYCQPWEPSFYQCRRIDNKCGKQEVNVDFYGEDVSSISVLLPENCCAKCHQTAGCKSYTFVNYNADGKPQCYLKKGSSDKRPLIGAVSAVIVKSEPVCSTPSGSQCGSDQDGAKCCPSGEYCQPWNPGFYQCHTAPAKCGKQEVGVDYYGEDLVTITDILPWECCDKCAATAGCKAYTFVNYNADGVAKCYLKTGTGDKRQAIGVVSASVLVA